MHLLLIEDDLGIVTPLTLYLQQAGHTVVVCHDGLSAFGVFQQEKPQLVILDINLPGKNGINICAEIRSISQTPIIVLSARASEEDKVKLLELGADDYVSKPFSPRELVARIMAVAKRSEDRRGRETKSEKTKLQIGALLLDTQSGIVSVGGVEIRLTKTEYAILEYCLRNMRSIIKRETLMKNIIGYENYIYDRTIDTHMKNLRKKLADAIEIETIRGVGYRVHHRDLP